MSFDGLTTTPQVNLESTLAQSDHPLIINVDNITIVGEIHIKTRLDPEIEKRFQETLDSSDFVVIEHQCNPNDHYSQMSVQERFMQKAQNHAIENNKPLLILDNEIADRYKPWLNAGVDTPRDNFNLLLGIDLVLSDFANGVSQSDSLQNLSNLYKFLYKNDDYSNKIAIATYLLVFNQPEIVRINEKVQMVISFLKLDAKAREIFYQERLTGIQKNIGERKMIVVVGRDHAQPIADSLQSGLITRIDELRAQKLNTSISEMKRRTGFNTIVNS